MLALSIDVFHSAYIIFGYYKEFIHFMGIPYAFPFLYGPIFYLYAKLISSDDHIFNAKYLLHFIPFIIVVIYGLFFVYLENSDFKLGLINNNIDKPAGLDLFNYLKPVHGLIYVFFTIRIVSIYNRRIKNSFSNIEKINLNWLRHLTIGLSIIWVIVVISYIVDAFSTEDIEMDHLIYMAASVLIYSIGYLSLQQPEIFDRKSKSEPKVEVNTKIKNDDTGSYRKSGLLDKDAEKYLNNLLRIMQTEKPYLNSELTLKDLAAKLSISTHNLSEILNTKLNQNFYDFINNYRVDEVKFKLADKEYEKYSLIALAFDSGFNSKSAFNTIFKKHTGLTPSQFRNNLQQSLKPQM